MGVITVFNVACYGVAFIGGLALLAAPFTRSGRAGPHWTRVALWICGPVATGWGALGLTLVFPGSLSQETPTTLSFTSRRYSQAWASGSWFYSRLGTFSVCSSVEVLRADESDLSKSLERDIERSNEVLQRTGYAGR